MQALNNPAVTEPARGDCLGSTCMQWTASGELSELDLHRVMDLLARVDENIDAIQNTLRRARTPVLFRWVDSACFPLGARR